MIKYFEIGWRSKEDGPGNRVVIYLQGCHLRCPWCHSPHSWDNKFSPLLFNPDLCTLCGFCVRSCKEGVHRIEEGLHIVEREHCVGCGACQKACPQSQPDTLGGALCMATREMEVEKLFDLVKAQLLMFRSNGGVTLSGGEALLQAEEVKKFLVLCRENQISTCIESSFTLPEKVYQMVADDVDYWLAGLRDTSFGEGNEDTMNDERIINNLALVSKKAKSIRARYPLISKRTTEEKHLKRFKELMERSGIQEIELLKCNPNMLHYYKLSGQQCKLNLEESIPTEKQYLDAYHYFATNGFSVY